MALDCDDALITLLEAPAPESQPVVRIGKATIEGKDVAGARVVLRSRYPVGAWAEVLRHPERSDEWLPEEVGTRQVERLDATHIYQRSDISLLFGAAHVRQQAVIGLRLMEDGPGGFRNCWYATDRTPYLSVIRGWDDGSDFLEVGHGAWEVRAGADGGAVVSFQLWASAGLVPARVAAWVLSRGLPELVLDYEAHVGEVVAAVAAEPAGQGSVR